MSTQVPGDDSDIYILDVSFHTFGLVAMTEGGHTVVYETVQSGMGPVQMDLRFNLGYVTRDNFIGIPHFEKRIHSSVETNKTLTE